jgi:hypothetical protein
MSELSKFANGVVSKFAKFVNQEMEIPDVSNVIPLAAVLLLDVNFHFAQPGLEISFQSCSSPGHKSAPLSRGV